MRYQYINTTQAPVSIEMTMHDITSLLQILEPIAADHDHDKRYTAEVFAQALRDAHARACDTMASDVAYYISQLSE